MKKLLYVRHGESTYNAEHRYAGTIDVDLSPKGIEQANQVAEALRGTEIDLIIASPQKRAQHTARIINEVLQLPMEIEDGLREVHMGLYEGLTRVEVEQKYPERWLQGSTRSFEYAPYEGETAKDVQERVYATLDRIIAKHPHKTILVVAHGFVGKAVHRYFNRHITDEQFFDFGLENCVVVEYEIK